MTLTLPCAKYALKDVNLPIVPSVVEDPCSSNPGGPIAPIGVEMSNSIFGTVQNDFTWLVRRVPWPMVHTSVGQRQLRGILTGFILGTHHWRIDRTHWSNGVHGVPRWRAYRQGSRAWWAWLKHHWICKMRCFFGSNVSQTWVQYRLETRCGVYLEQELHVIEIRTRNWLGKELGIFYYRRAIIHLSFLLFLCTMYTTDKVPGVYPATAQFTHGNS